MKPVMYLMVFAYDLPAYRIVGGPAWVDSAVWQVSARTAKPASRVEKQEMARTLLADRFGLVVHVETRRLPIYSLVVARLDGRLGPKATPGILQEQLGLRLDSDTGPVDVLVIDDAKRPEPD